MASIAEILIGQAGQAGTMKQDNSGIVSGFNAGNAAANRGAELALEAEKLGQSKTALEQKKAEVEDAKWEKSGETLSRGFAIKDPKARAAYFDKFVPKRLEALGTAQDIDPEAYKFAVTSPENQARLETLVGLMQNGKMSKADGISVLNDQEKFSQLVPAYKSSSVEIPSYARDDFYEKAGDAQKTAIGAQAQRDALMSTNSRFQQGEQRQEQQFKEGKKESLGKEILKLDLPTMGATLKRIETLIPKGIDGFEGNEEIPGLGGYRAKLPIGQVTPKERENRQAIQRLGNSYVKLVTGSGGSTAEMNRILGSIGLDQAVGEGGGITTLFTGSKSSKDVVQGIRDIKAAFKAQESVLANTYGKEMYDSVVPPSSGGKKSKNETSTEKTVADKAVTTVISNLQLLYDKYAGNPAKQAKVMEAAKAKGLTLKGK